MKPLKTEPCLEHPDYFPLPKPKKSWKDMEITPELSALHEENIKKFFSKPVPSEDEIFPNGINDSKGG